MSELEPAQAHEFGADDNRVFAALATAMHFVSVMTVLAGGALVLTGALEVTTGVKAVIPIGEGVALGGIGVWLYGAAGSFRAIVDTQGADMQNLMSALGKLRGVYQVQAMLWAIAIALVFVGMFVH